MITIGLTGSIGSGKSTLARSAASELNIPVFDADQAVHDLYATDEGLKAFIADKCGVDILRDGQIDRQILKTVMKEQPDKWKEIEAAVSRHLWPVYDAFVEEHKAAGKKYVIADIPLLFEKGSESRFDYTINVFLPYELQKSRALARAVPKITEADFERRFAVFLPNEVRNRKSDFTIDNSGEALASLLQLRAHLSHMKDREEAVPSVRRDFNEAAVYVGSFDPITLGHLDVIKGAAKMPYDKIYVGVGINEGKTPMFTAEERVAMINREIEREIAPHLPAGREVVAVSYEGLTVDFMKKVGASLCIRGLRGIKDLEEEGDLAAINKDLYGENLGADFTQVYFATSNPELRHVSSSFARALCNAKKDVTLLKYVSADVAAKMVAKRDKR